MDYNGVWLQFGYKMSLNVILINQLPYLNRYLKEHYSLEMQNKSKSEYLGHPINAYHLIRHVALGWDGINENILQNTTYWTQYLGSLIWNGVVDDISMYGY